jgi:hypothetical protein
MNAFFWCAESVAFLTSFAVLFVSGVPQTDSSDATPLRSSATAVRTYVAAEYAALESVELPANFSVHAFYLPLVQSMLRQSPTFRRQCLRIASAGRLTVVLQSDPPRHDCRVRAWTRILRAPHGRLLAIVQVGEPGRAVELIAHELEHVIEQLDGIDLRSKARLASTGVRACDCGDSGAFETDRASSIGLNVAREIRERHP